MLAQSSVRTNPLEPLVRTMTPIEKLGGRVAVDEATGIQVVVDLRGTQITDADLSHLKGLEQLRELNLRQTQISDAGLIHLTGLKNLQVLALGKTQVTDGGLVHIKEMTRL